MASIVAKRWKPLTNYMEESVFYLNDVTARFRYDNNVRTDEIQGHTYTATSTDTFDQIHVFIEGKKPLIEPEKLHQAQEDGERISSSLKMPSSAHITVTGQNPSRTVSGPLA